MKKSPELKRTTDSFLVVSDDSNFSATVLQKIQALVAAPFIPLNLASFFSLTAVPAEPIIFLVHSAERAEELFRRQHPYVLLISDNAAIISQYADQVADVLPWPTAEQHLLKRLEVVRELRRNQQQIDQLRHSLAWHKARVDREHQLVEHIFQNALSRNFLDYPYVQTHLTPVSKFNGDLCLIAPGPLGNLYMLMADFTGHGLAPATGALPLSQAFFAMADRGVSVAEMVTEFNFRMNRLLPDDMFCAALLLELSANGERVTYWNGGMPAALVFDQAGAILRRLAPTHLALGVVDDEEFDSRVATFRAPQGSSIALFTDGVIELLGHQQRFLGADAFETLLSNYPKVEDFTKFVEELEHFRGETPLHDDLSLAILSCRPTELDESEKERDLYGMPFHLEVKLEPEHLRQIDPIGHIMAAFGQLPFLRRHRTTIYLLLAEAFNNALEHGLLGLDSQLKQDPEGFAQYYQLRQQRLATLEHGEISVRVDFATNSKQLKVQVSDSGKGFNLVEQARDPKHSYGRGLDLLRQLTTELHWDQNDRSVHFSYQL